MGEIEIDERRASCRMGGIWWSVELGGDGTSDEEEEDSTGALSCLFPPAYGDPSKERCLLAIGKSALVECGRSGDREPDL